MSHILNQIHIWSDTNGKLKTWQSWLDRVNSAASDMCELTNRSRLGIQEGALKGIAAKKELLHWTALYKTTDVLFKELHIILIRFITWIDLRSL